MKLFLTWLLGVPVLVLAMVMARAMTPRGLDEQPRAVASARQSPCPRQGELKHVDSVVTKDGHRIPCDRHPVK